MVYAGRKLPSNIATSPSASPDYLNRLNFYFASLLAMVRALSNLFRGRSRNFRQTRAHSIA